MRDIAWKHIALFLSVLLIVPIGHADKDIPTIIKPCSRDAVDIDKCLVSSIQTAFSALKDGLPEFGLQTLDPYKRKELVIEYKQNQISGRAVLKDIVATGMTKAKVKSVRSNIQDDDFELEVDLFNKKIFIKGLLSGEGRLNALILKAGGGEFNNTMTDVDYTWKIKGKTYMKNGEKYVKITEFSMRPDVGDMKVHIPDVTNSKEINLLALFWVNEYWRIIYRELLPIVELTWKKFGIKLSNQIFSNIPYDKLFPISED